MFYTSFKPQWAIFENPFNFPKSVFFQNYRTAWITGNFYRFFINSVVITGISIVSLLILTSLAAFGFTRRGFRFREGLFLFCITGMMIGHQVYMIPMYQMISKMHLINTYLGIILAYTGWTPFGIFILRSFFNGIPSEIQDAARIDGCSDFAIYLRIMLPLSRPALATVSIFYFVWIWNDFVYPLILLQDPNMSTVTLGLVGFKGQYTLDWGAQTAALAIGSIGPMLVYYFFQKHFVRGLVTGAVKG